MKILNDTLRRLEAVAGGCAAAGVSGAFLGVWLDGMAGTKPFFTLVGVLLGIVVAFYGAYKMLLAFLSVESSEDSKD